MVTKKYKLLFGILFLFLATSVTAQVGGAGSVYDSSVISKKRMNQQNQFWDGSYNFPAKPRNMWEVGASLGVFTISGDVSVRPFTFPNFEAHVRKAFGYVFSMRLQYLNAKGQGMNYNISQNFLKNSAWNRNLAPAQRYYAPDALLNATTTGRTVFTDGAGNIAASPNVVYYNYQTRLQDLGLQGIVTLNNVRFHKQKTGMVIYGGGGIGVTVFKTMVNALDANGRNYTPLFNTVFGKYGGGNYKQRKDILKDLRAGMDKTYETDAEAEGTRRPVFGKDKTLKPSGTVLAGIAFKLGKRVNLAIEDRWTFVKTDLLDGQRWQEHAWGDASLTRDFDSYNYASIGLNVNLGGKSVEPLWWVNPLDYAYDELRNHRNVKFPDNNCKDADGDGVCDHLDREPNTPAGCPVDTHGVTRDTDGDGVPDCKDKQLITPTECQPVNPDGVGKCPDPECCKNPVVVNPPSNNCPCDYPTLIYKGSTSGLSNANRAMLATVASKMRANPTCNISIVGYPETSKASQAACQKRLETIKIYLIERENISADRISTNCDLETKGDKNSVDVKCN